MPRDAALPADRRRAGAARRRRGRRLQGAVGRGPAREARLGHGGVRGHRHARAAPAAQAQGDRRAVAHLRLRRPAHEGLAVRVPPAVQAHLAGRRPRHDRVPAQRRLRQRLHGPAEGPVLRAERQDRQADLQDQELQALRRGLTDARQRHDLPVVHGLRGVRPGRPEPHGLRDRDGRDDREAEVALQGHAVRVLAAAARRDPLRGLVGRQRARDPGEDREARVDLPDRQPGEHLGRVLAGADLHRRTRTGRCSR